MASDAVDERFVIEFSTNRLPSENPADYFEGVSQVLDAFQSLDANLLNFILPAAKTRLNIERLETSSLKLWLATTLENLPDDALRELDWKKFVGHYLLKVRNAFVRFLRKTPKVTETRMIEDLGQEVDSLASEVVQAPRRISRRLLISILVRIIRATQSVPGNETVKVTVFGETSVLPRDAEVTPNVAEELANRESEPFEQEMKLLVKKPDMLGRSQWEFLNRGHVIRAKMGDAEWVKQYQGQEITLKPGDAIEARVRITPRGPPADADYAYTITEVRRVIASSIVQLPLLFEKEDGDSP
jgi:hypothetical protein